MNADIYPKCDSEVELWEDIGDRPGAVPRGSRLIGDLVYTFFGAARDLAGSREEGFVSLDEGVVILARHAQSLGYDPVVLSLDELILWLASSASRTASADNLVFSIGNSYNGSRYM